MYHPQYDRLAIWEPVTEGGHWGGEEFVAWVSPEIAMQYGWEFVGIF